MTATATYRVLPGDKVRRVLATDCPFEPRSRAARAWARFDAARQECSGLDRQAAPLREELERLVRQFRMKRAVLVHNPDLQTVLVEAEEVLAEGRALAERLDELEQRQQLAAAQRDQAERELLALVFGSQVA